MVIKSSGTDSEPTNPRLPSNYDWKMVESRVRRFNAEVNLQKAVRDALGKNPVVGYVEGPPTLNGVPHIGHVRGRIMKDLWYRFGTLSKKNIVFRAGWDCQGLPVELQAEKEFGLSGNKWEDLKVDRRGQDGRGLQEAHREVPDRVGGGGRPPGAHAGQGASVHDLPRFVHREGVEVPRESLGRRDSRGGVQGRAVLPVCMTSLSHAEAVLGYETLEDPSLYYKVKMPDGAYLVIWTTMPFTVVTDELVGVKPDADYAYVKVGDEVWVMGKERKEGLAKELNLEFGETVKVVKGRELEGSALRPPAAPHDTRPGETWQGGEDTHGRGGGLRRHSDGHRPRPPRPRERRGGLPGRDEEEGPHLRSHRRQGQVHRGRGQVLGDVRQGLRQGRD